MGIKGEKMAFYKITDAALLEKINAFFDQLDAAKIEIQKFVEAHGFEYFCTRDSLSHGFEFVGMLVKHDQEIDLDKWKTLPFDEKHKIAAPRKSNRKFYNEWLKSSPILKVSYLPLINLIIKDDIRTAYSTGLNWADKECFLFETKYAVVPEAIEILTSEYIKLNKGGEG